MEEYGYLYNKLETNVKKFSTATQYNFSSESPTSSSSANYVLWAIGIALLVIFFRYA